MGFSSEGSHLKGVNLVTETNEDETNQEKPVGPLRRFLQRTTTIGATLPPYLLIGILFLVQHQAEKANDRDTAKAAVIALHQASVGNFNDCVFTARGRQANKINFYGLYDVLRVQAPQAAPFADKLQAVFDENFNKNRVKVPEDCLTLPEFKEFTKADFPPER